MTNKTTLKRLKLDPYFSKTIDTNLNVWSHDQNSYEIKFEFYDRQCNKPIDLTGADMRILLDHADSKPKIYPLEVESKVLGLAKFIMPEQIRGCEGKFTAHIYADYPNKTHDFGSFTFYTKLSRLDGDLGGCMDKIYVSEFEKALEDIKEFKVDIDKNINEMKTHFDGRYEKTKKDIEEIELLVNENEVLKKTDFNDYKDKIDGYGHSEYYGKTFENINKRLDHNESKKREYGINIKDLGACGDGVADDTDVLKKAIELAKETNNFVYIPKGVYVISDKINLFQGCKIVGSEDRPALYFNNKNSGIENTGRMVSVRNLMLQLSSEVDKTDTVGINFHGTTTDYAAYCELNNLFVVGFGTNVRLNKIFEVDLKRVVSRDSNTSFDFYDVTTLLNISDSYALNNKRGWVVKKVHYSSFTNIASDQNEEPYLFEGNSGVVINGMGMEKNTGCCVINDSFMSLNGLIGVLNKGKEKRPSLIEVNGDSKVSLSSSKEISLDSGSLSVHSVSVGSGSELNIETTTTKKPFYHHPLGLIYGTFSIENNRVVANGYNYIHNGLGPYGNKCPKYINDGKYKIGDKYINDDFSTKRPAIEWTCIVGGETGEWRALFAYNSGPLSAKPDLEKGFNFFGFRYAVTDDVPYEIVWLGNRWLGEK